MDKTERNRKSKRDYNNKFRCISVRYTPEDYKVLEDRAAELECSVTQYVRSRSLGRTRSLIRTPKINLEAVIQLRQIGVKLDRYLRYMDEEQDPEIFLEIEQHLRGLIQELRQ